MSKEEEKEEKNVSDVTVRRERGFTSSITASTSLLFISLLLFKRQNNLGRNPVPAKVSGDLLIFPNKLETITSFFFLSRGEAGSERIKGFSRLPGWERKQKEKGKKMESEQDKRKVAVCASQVSLLFSLSERRGTGTRNLNKGPGRL